VKTETIAIDGLPTRIRCGGAGTTPIVLLHGATPGLTPYCSGLHVWGESFDLLARETSVVAIDMPGAGGSALGLAPLTIATIVARVLGMLDHLRIERCHVLGHDLGGLVALALALDHPSRIAAVSVAACPSAAPTGDGPHNVTLESPPAPLFGQASQRWALERLSYRGLALDAALLADCVAAGQGVPHREAMARASSGELASSIQQTKGRLYEQARTHGLATPIQVIWGSHDPLATIDHGLWLYRIVAAKQTAVQFHLLNRAGHLLFHDDPAAFTRVVAAFHDGLSLRKQ
jgi:2-hydroxy-6-oxonona-2,4-dienedioate hydrolase